MNKQTFKQYRRWIIFLLCIIPFAFLAWNAAHHGITRADALGQNLRLTVISDGLTPIVKAVTTLGSAKGLIAEAVILLIALTAMRRWKLGVSAAVNLLLAWLLNERLKGVFQRPRPADPWLVQETGFSFPSGHSMVSMAFYGFLIYLVWRCVTDKKLKYTLTAVLGALILMIGLSRIYLGVHYVTDVIGGFLIALCYLTVYTAVIDRLVFRAGTTEKSE